jgi:Xaa-Pro aminopeptidase
MPQAPGMVFTIEPWYYNHDRGVATFIEDVLPATPGGVEVLTRRLPRTPEALERLTRR